MIDAAVEARMNKKEQQKISQYVKKEQLFNL